ncbi:MAG: hypothetical protein WD602_10925 [Actinomycetota bacterium]
MQIAAIYRGLRKGREDAKHAPGAADFYYGEMEMRRHSSDTPTAERAILFAYWLLSGYALRTSRALIALVAVVLVDWLALGAVGYQQPARQEAVLRGQIGDEPVEVDLTEAPPVEPGWDDAFWASVESAAFRAPEDSRALTRPGQITTTALRVLGPGLIVSAVLSLRGRVKR